MDKVRKGDLVVLEITRSYTMMGSYQPYSYTQYQFATVRRSNREGIAQECENLLDLGPIRQWDRLFVVPQDRYSDLDAIREAIRPQGSCYSTLDEVKDLVRATQEVFATS